jgi:hypothetical protein
VKARIHSIIFDKRERPKQAVVLTQRGIVQVEWKCVAGDWCWFTGGTGEAKMHAVPAIERIHRCFAPQPARRRDVRCRYCGKPSEDGSGVCDRCERTYERQ